MFPFYIYIYIYIIWINFPCIIFQIVMKTEMATGQTIQAVQGFDKSELKKADTVEKNPLPDKEGELKSTI